MFAERRGASTNIDHHVVDLANDGPHQFALRVLDLIVQPAQYAFDRFGVIVLHKVCINARLFTKGSGVKTFTEKSAIIAIDVWLDNFYVGNGGRNDVHFLFS